MKALKAFAITLVIILMLGCALIAGRAILKKQDLGSILSSTKSSITGLTGMGSGKTSGTSSNASSSASSKKSSSSKKSKANPITKAIVSEAIDSYIDSSSGQVKEIAESMSEEDKDTVTEIIASNVSLDSVSQVQSYVSSGDTEGLMEYAEENLSEEELQELKDIMSKYVK